MKKNGFFLLATVLGLTLCAGNCGKVDNRVSKKTIDYDLIISADTSFDEDVVKVTSDAKLKVDECLLVKGKLTVRRNDLDVTKGRLRLMEGSCLKLDDIMIDVEAANVNYTYYGEPFKYIDLYERNGKLKFTGGNQAVVKVTLPKGLKFEDIFSVTNLKHDTVVFCNGEKIESEKVTLVNELHDVKTGTLDVTEDCIFEMEDRATVRENVILNVIPGNDLYVMSGINIYGSIIARKGEFHTDLFPVRLNAGSRLDLGDIVIECEQIDPDNIYSSIDLRASKGEKMSLGDGENVKVNVAIPKDSSFDDLFDLENNRGKVEIYVNGTKTPYEGVKLTERLSLNNEKDIIVDKDETVDSYLAIPADKTLTVLPGVVLKFFDTASIYGELNFNTGCFSSGWMWLEPGGTINIDGDITVKCSKNNECNALTNRRKALIFSASLNGPHKIENGYACIVDITMPDETKFDDYFVFTYQHPGMIVNVNGKPVSEVSKNLNTLIGCSENMTYTITEDYDSTNQAIYIGNGYTCTLKKGTKLTADWIIVEGNFVFDLKDVEKTFFTLRNQGSLEIGDIKAKIELLSPEKYTGQARLQSKDGKIIISESYGKGLNITLEEGKFKDYFVIQGEGIEGEIYCNGKKIR